MYGFLDGEDAQQPIIMGVIGYNQYTAVMKNVPDTAFTPFSGYTTKDTVPKTEEGVAEEEAEGVLILLHRKRQKRLQQQKGLKHLRLK